MKDNDTTAAPINTASPPVGRTAAKRRAQLHALEERRRNTMAQLNRARSELAQAVAEAEARDRRRQRYAQTQDLKRVKFILGGLVLTAMREGGPKCFSMSADALLQLTDKDRDLVDKVAMAISHPAQSCEPLDDQGQPRCRPLPVRS